MLPKKSGYKTSKLQGKKCKYLLDASALYPMLVRGIPFNSEECAVSSLTEFEIGNTLWKENRKKELDDSERIAEIFEESMVGLSKIWVDSLVRVLAIAVERNLTFYDASYAYLAEKENMKLVTEDVDLLKKCKCAIHIKDMNAP
jgi:predicted nucleic acid-binding protein